MAEPYLKEHGGRARGLEFIGETVVLSESKVGKIKLVRPCSNSNSIILKTSALFEDPQTTTTAI